MTLRGKLYQRLLKVCETKSRINNLNTMQTSANNPEKMHTPKFKLSRVHSHSFKTTQTAKSKNQKAALFSKVQRVWEDM
jgi:hypothetical protein